MFKLVGSAKSEVEVVELVDHKILEESGANPTNEIVSPSQIEVGAVKLTVCSGLKFNVIVSDTSKAVPQSAFARAVTFKTTCPANNCEADGVNVGFSSVGLLKPALLPVPSTVHKIDAYSVAVTPEITNGSVLHTS